MSDKSHDHDRITDDLAEGVRLFNEGEYFEAHEVWEDEWHGVVGDNKNFLQGLIQTAAVYVHLTRGNPEGVRSLSTSALIYLEEIPSTYRGIDVDYLRRINEEAKSRAKKSEEKGTELILREPELSLDTDRDQ